MYTPTSFQLAEPFKAGEFGIGDQLAKALVSLLLASADQRHLGSVHLKVLGGGAENWGGGGHPNSILDLGGAM